MTVKVLHILNRFTFGGTEQVILNLLNHSKSDIEHYVCSLTNIDSKFADRVLSKRKNIFNLDKKEGHDLSLPFKIAKFCRLNSVHVVHSLGWGTYIEGLWAVLLTINRTRFVHSFRGKTAEETHYIPKRRIVAQHLFSHFCSAIIAPSVNSCREYAALAKINPDKVQVIYNGVDTKRYIKFLPSVRQELRKEYQIEENEIVIGTVGRFDPVKNIDGLVRAYAGLPAQTIRQSRLLIVGDGPERGSIRELVRSLRLDPCVIFVGMRSNVQNFLNMMDVYIQPSHFEGVPNAVLEAMATGLPVVATKVGGVAEIVVDGTTGILVDPHNLHDLKAGIQDMLRPTADLKGKGEAGRHRVESLFSINKMVADYDALFQNMVLSSSVTRGNV